MFLIRGVRFGVFFLMVWLLGVSVEAAAGARLVSRTIAPPRRGAPGDRYSPEAERRMKDAPGERAAWIVLFDAPVSGDAQKAMQAAGRLGSYIPDNAFILLAEPDGLAAVVAARSDIVRVDLIQPGDRIAPELKARMGHAPEGSQMEIMVRVPRDGGEKPAVDAIQQSGGEVIGIGRGRRWASLRVKASRTVIDAVASLPDVEWIQEYTPPVLFNDVAAQTNLLNVAPVRAAPHFLTGAGQVVAVCDTGLDTGDLATIHPDFSNRVQAVFAWGRSNDWSDIHGHGTHCAGSVLGSGAAFSNGLFQGMASGARLVFQSFADENKRPSVPDDLGEFFSQAYSNDARIHSDSWGTLASGAYMIHDSQCDEFMWEHPDFLLVYAAGNAGEDGNGDGVIDLSAISSPASAKNVLAVGAACTFRPPGSGGSSDEHWRDKFYYHPPLADGPVTWSADGLHQGMAAFSSRGPCRDGRVKPDIVSPGTAIVSCRSRAPRAEHFGSMGKGVLGNAASNYYVFSEGTSMATPLAAGAAALVRQYLADHRGIPHPSASLVKALLLAGARSLAPGQYGVWTAREIPLTPRPNPVEGWGHADVAGGLFPSGGTNILWEGESISTGQAKMLAVEPGTGARLSIVLAWTDYPGSPAAESALVNDLDLQVITPDGRILYALGAGTPDHVNNVEGVDVAATVTGSYAIVVSGYNVPHGPQPFSLVVHAKPLAGPSGISAVWHEPEFIHAETTAVMHALIRPGSEGLASVSNFYRINGGLWSSVPMDLLWMRPEQRIYAAEAPELAAGDTLEYCTVAYLADLTELHSATQSICVQWGDTIHVAAGGAAIPPYDTPEKGLTNLHEALALATPGIRVMVGPGIWSAGGRPFRVTNSIHLLGTVGQTILHGEGQNCVLSNFSASVVENLIVTGGVDTNADGVGGIYMNGGWLLNCAVVSNTGNSCGGVMAVGATISNCVIAGNLGDFSGGAYLSGLSLMTDSRIMNNTAQNAAGIRIYGGTALPLLVDRCTVVSNRAASDGGGLHVSIMGSAEVRNSLVAWNEAGSRGGGVYSITMAAPSALRGCTFFGNSATDAVVYGYAPFVLENCLFASNAAPDVALYEPEANARVTLNHCRLSAIPTHPRVDVINPVYDDPILRNPAAGDFRLAPHSPCVGAASESSLDTLGCFDLDGHARRLSGSGDIGAYEYGPMSLSTSVLYFAATAGGQEPEPQTIVLSNQAEEALAFQAESGSNATWCSISPAFGLLQQAASVACTIAVHGVGLPWGVHGARLSIRPEGADSAIQYLDVLLELSSQAATVTLDNLSHSYDGMAKSASVATDPAGLAVEILYDGFTNAPLNAGSYAVRAEIRDPVYAGTATGQLIIAHADQQITFPDPGVQRLTNRIGLSAWASSGLPVAFEVLSGPAVLDSQTNLSFTATGTVAVAAAQPGDTNWHSAPQVVRSFAVNNEFTLLVFSSHGACLPPPGEYVYPAGLPITSVLTGPVTGILTQYVGAGWTLSGNEPVSGTGTLCELTLTNDAALQWFWNTNVLLDIGIMGRGIIAPPVHAWQPLGAMLTVTAVPDAGAWFQLWTGDIQGSPEQPEQILLMDRARQLDAWFRNRPTPFVWLLLEDTD